MRVIGLILAFCTSAVFWAPPAEARFGDCSSPDYLAGFPDAPGTGDLLCVEQFRFTVDTPAGPRNLRAISDISAGWAVPPAYVSAAERGARAAAALMPELGDFTLDDVTLLLLDNVHDFDETRQILAMTDGRRGTDHAANGECLITLYGLSESTPAEFAITVAHEIFHCLQYASLSPQQMDTYGRGGSWWIEGTAEYFAARAVDGAPTSLNRGHQFDAAVSAGKPLFEMAHEAVVFFDWLGQTRGVSALMPFQRQMAGSDGAAQQRTAMRGALDDTGWLAFAKAYVDRDIRLPRGGALALSPTPSETLTISAPGTQRFTLAPFAIAFGTADYQCGQWGNRLAPERANLALRAQSDSRWQSWPDEINAEADHPNSYLFAGMHTGDRPANVTLRIERHSACQPCAGIRALDACVAGVWKMTGGGPIEWMRARHLPIRNVREGPRVVSFGSDGVYSTAPLDIEFETQTGDANTKAQGHALSAAGNWSAKGGELNICQHSGGISGTATVTEPKLKTRIPVARAGAGTLKMRYGCSATTLKTTLPISGMPPMVTIYTKIAKDAPAR